MEAKRRLSDPKRTKLDVTPSTEPSPITCAYPQCSDTHRLITPSFEAADNIKAALPVEANQDQPFVLCPSHYHKLYRHFRVSPCAGCGATPKRGACFIRHSPDPVFISRVMSENAGFDVNLCEKDNICLNCYKSHLIIIKAAENERSNPENFLEELIPIWEFKYADAETDKVTRTLLHVVLYIAREFVSQRAVLLPNISRMFCQEYDQENIASDLHLEVSEGTITFTSKWLLSQLILHFQDHIKYKCIHRKFGTVLFHKGSDLLVSLSWALGRVHENTIHDPYTHNPPTNQLSVVMEAAHTINERIHSEIANMERENSIHSPSGLNLGDLMNKSDPILQSFLEAVTRAKRDQIFSNRNTRSQPECHKRKLRQFFLKCLLMYCANSRTPTPLHILLSDTIEVCGGSRKLMRIFNQFGVVASPDTHDRYMTSVAEQQRGRSVWNDLNNKVFTVASVDNFDMLKCHAAVYCGDQYRSYHGTTIQLVQPLPQLYLHGNSTCTCTCPSHSTTDMLEKPPMNEITGEVLNTRLPVTTTVGENSRHLSTFDSRERQPVAKSTLVCTTSTRSSNKRKATSSPANSPHKLGKKGPERRRTVAVRNLSQALEQTESTVPSVTTNVETCTCTCTVSTSENTINTCTLKGFKEQLNEKCERMSLKSKTLAYMVSKQSSNNGNVLKEFKLLYSKCTTCTNENTEPSTIYYMELLDEHPDSSDTMKHVSEILLHKASSSHQDNYVLLIGDGKTYEHLMNIKRLYGAELDQLLIFPGDWHTLYNYQPVLMKIYYHTGLMELAKACGHRGETLTALQKCSNFKRTHHFLLQAWQALYRSMIMAFTTDHPNCFQNITPLLQSTSTTPDTVLNIIQSTLTTSKELEKFYSFVEHQCASDDTWKFWAQFVFEDCMAYVGLFLSIRCRNWDLRVSSLKLMAPLFCAYDRTTYQRLIPNHLSAIQTFPKKVIDSLKKGGFSVSISGGIGHCVALDESHEMCINKEMKEAVVRPTTAYLQKASLFLRHRIATHKALLHQIFHEPKESEEKEISVYDTSKEVRNREENIEAIIKAIEDYQLLPAKVPNRGLINVFSGEKANHQQTHDLLNFRKIGSDDLSHYIKYRILHHPSTNAPVRRNKLLTMAPIKTVGKRNVNLQKKENAQIMKCLRQRLAWCNRTGQTYDPTTEQYSKYPRAIADVNGLPHKGSKSTLTEKISKRYQSVVVNNLPTGWTPDTVIIDGMFLINTSPLRSTTTISHYATLLFNRFITPYYLAGAKEVHLIFDTERRQQFNPKCFEHQRRSDKNNSSNDHHHVTFITTTNVPQNWRSFIQCRECKRSIIQALGLSYLQTARFKLLHDQNLILAGCFTHATDSNPMIISGDGSLPEQITEFRTNAEEADMIIWRHALKCSAQRVLVYSPDTDVYVIGLPLIDLSREFIVQINVPHAQDLKYVSLNSLREALIYDPDLASLPNDLVATTFLALFTCSGCDYISFISGFGKVAIMNTFYQHASFITGDGSKGRLSDCSPLSKEQGYLAFLRLIGTIYFKKHYSAFVSLKGIETPQQLLNSIHSSTLSEQVITWYNDIRAIVSDRITDEDQRMPSESAMWRHWLRSCWIIQMWTNSPEQDVFSGLPPPEESGWLSHTDGATTSWSIDWDCPRLQTKVQDTINFLTKGCACQKGHCESMRCGCRKNGSTCGPGCRCQGCQNLTVSIEPSSHEDSDSEDQASDTSDSEQSEDELQAEVVTEDFTDLLVELPEVP